MSIAAPAIGQEFHFTNSQFAMIFNGFLIAYTVGQLFAGSFMDWIGVRVGFAVSVMFWSIVCILTSAAKGVGSFAECRFLLGTAESGNFPAGVKVVSEWFPASERSSAVGFFTSGASAGAILAPPLIAFLCFHFGWRVAFVAVGVPGFIWTFVWWKVYGLARKNGETERGNITPDQSRIAGVSLHATAPWRQLLRQRAVWGLVFARLAEEPAAWFYFNWLPLYLERFRGVSLLRVGYLLIFPFLTLGAGYSVGGWIASKLIKSGWSLDRARKTVMVISAICMVSSIPAVDARTNAWFLSLICLATFGHGSWGTNVYTMPTDIVPHQWVGSIYGLSAFGGGLGSIIFMQLTGRIVDLQKSFQTPFVLAGLLPLIAVVLLLAVTGTIEQIDTSR